MRGSRFYGVGAIGPCGTWFSVRVVCGGVLLVSFIFEVMLGVLVFGGHRHHELPSPSLSIVSLLFVLDS